MKTDAPRCTGRLPKDGSFNLLQNSFSKWIISQNEIEVNTKKHLWNQHLVGWFVDFHQPHIHIYTPSAHLIGLHTPFLNSGGLMWVHFGWAFHITPPKFNSKSPWKMVGKEDDPFLLERPIFRGELLNFRCIRIPPRKDPWRSPLPCIGFIMAAYKVHLLGVAPYTFTTVYS